MNEVHGNCKWDAPRIEQLKLLHASGISCSRIAAKLGTGITRNGVIGKLHRLGLSHAKPVIYDNTSEAPERKSRKMPDRPPPSLAGTIVRVKPRITAPVLARPLPMPKPLAIDDGPVTLLHLSDKTCKWPIGDPQHADFRFCGHGPRDGSPYCEYHDRMAYVPDRKPKGQKR